MNQIYIDEDLCSKCKGKCCKRSGCTFLPEDFDKLTYDYLMNEIKTKPISISAIIYMKKVGNQNMYYPILVPRIKNNNRESIDLISYKSGCSILTDKGCPLEKKPSMALSLKPERDGNCIQTISQIQIIKKWMKHQAVLEKIVKELTGMSLEERIHYEFQLLDEFLINLSPAQKYIDQEVYELLDMRKLVNERIYSKKTVEFLEIVHRKNKKRKK